MMAEFHLAAAGTWFCHTAVSTCERNRPFVNVSSDTYFSCRVISDFLHVQVK